MRARLLLLVAAGLLVAADTPNDDAKKELDKFKGTWKATAGAQDGKPFPDEDLKTLVLTFAGDKYTAKYKDQTEAGTMKLDPAKKQIDLNITDGEDKGKKQYGLYAVDGDTLKLCFAMPDKERPKEMAAKEGSEHVLVTLKREK